MTAENPASTTPGESLKPLTIMTDSSFEIMIMSNPDKFCYGLSLVDRSVFMSKLSSLFKIDVDNSNHMLRINT